MKGNDDADDADDDDDDKQSDKSAASIQAFLIALCISYPDRRGIPTSTTILVELHSRS